MARTLINVPQKAKRGEIITIKTLISHVMETGFRHDNVGKVVPRDIITSFVCTYNGQPIFDATLYQAIASTTGSAEARREQRHARPIGAHGVSHVARQEQRTRGNRARFMSRLTDVPSKACQALGLPGSAADLGEHQNTAPDSAVALAQPGRECLGLISRCERHQ